VFVKALVELAHNFDLPTVAEWVTSEQDARLLQSWGVDYLQGFFYGEASMRAPWASGLQALEAKAG
jgi:EAL domain-containing protein (putative c-di-GMP-specific phosphodiesterase class I)